MCLQKVIIYTIKTEGDLSYKQRNNDVGVRETEQCGGL